jgi:hypothetical protein
VFNCLWTTRRHAVHQREANAINERYCVDCGNRVRIEHDHDHPHVEDGPTSLANLLDRCHLCHVAKTKRDRERRRRRRPATAAAHQNRAPPDTG